ncbi:ABC transporter permease (plasmid) [Bacillus sp. JAS24-2]|uniref:ABC transporter permease n=1 Tax=Bacillus sp. JAS24-2 TaxID=2217832 RepID=UPI0011F09343|nr:ABC transporter permease [Bacillus sp. JAS24-2]QEL82799.1 ABC transporter permease [Bacillus sp. JAS24-2]
MNPLFIYFYRCNRKKIAVFYSGFIIISLLLLFSTIGLSGVLSPFIKDLVLLIYLIIIGVAAFSLLFIALPSFNKTLKNSMIRYTAIPTHIYIYMHLFFFTLMFIILLGIGLIFSYYFSQSFYDGKVIGYDPSLYGGEIIGEFRQEFRKLYSYGIFQHIFAFILWGIDFMSVLISCYFITAIIKLFPVKSSMNKIILFVIFVAIFSTIQIIVMNVLSKLEKYAVTIKSSGFMDKNDFFDTSFYPIEDFTIFGLCFTYLLIIALVTITGRIIDKKLEI